MLAGLTTQLEASTQSLNEAQANKAFAESMLSSQLAAAQSNNGADPQSLQQQLNDLQAQLMTARARYTDKHPEVIKLQGEIADLQRKMQTPAAAATKASAPIPDSIQIQQLRAQVDQ